MASSTSMPRPGPSARLTHPSICRGAFLTRLFRRGDPPFDQMTQTCVALEVVFVQRLLQPDYPVLLEQSGSSPHRLLNGPAPACVNDYFCMPSCGGHYRCQELVVMACIESK